MSHGRVSFYVATSYEQKDRANKLARALMDSRVVDNSLLAALTTSLRFPQAPLDFWPTFPWWMYSAEEDKHNKHMGAVGVLEIVGAAEANLFVWLHPARKGAWCELGAACYRNVTHHDNRILMVVPESQKDEYLPPFAYQPGVTIINVPDELMDQPDPLAQLIINVYLGTESKHDNSVAINS